MTETEKLKAAMKFIQGPRGWVFDKGEDGRFHVTFESPDCAGTGHSDYFESFGTREEAVKWLEGMEKWTSNPAWVLEAELRRIQSWNQHYLDHPDKWEKQDKEKHLKRQIDDIEHAFGEYWVEKRVRTDQTSQPEIEPEEP